MNRMQSRIYPFFCALFFCIAGITGPASGQPLRSAAELDSPPFSITAPDGQADGFSVELLKAAAAAMGKEVIFKVAPWNEIKTELADGRLDVLPLVGRTPEREALYDFTAPYLTLHGALFVREDCADIQSLKDLKGKRIAVMKGDNAEEYVRRKNLSDQLILTHTFAEAFQQLSTGEADAVIAQKLMGTALIRQMNLKNIRIVGQPDHEFKQEFCFAVPKGNTETLALLNEGLTLLHADGTYRRIFSKWLFADPTDDFLSEVILVGSDRNYPPYEFLNEQGVPDGFNIELTQAIAKAMGVTVQFQLDVWTNVVSALKNGTIDTIVDMAHTSDRAKFFDFTAPHFDTYSAVYAGPKSPAYSNVSSLSRRRVAVQSAGISEKNLRLAAPDAIPVLVESEMEALELLSRNEVDFAWVLRPAADWIIKYKNLNGLRVKENDLNHVHAGFAVRKGNDQLIQLFEAGLQRVRENGEYNRLHDKWLAELQPHDAWSIFHPYVRWSLGILALFLLWLAFWIHLLQKEVKKRTALLRESEEALSRRNRQLELTQFALDRSSDSSFWIRPDASFAYVNEAACNGLGYSKDELLHMSVMNIDPDFPAEIWADHWKKMKNKGGMTFESHHKTKDGRVFPALVHASFICFDDQEFICAFVHDITNRKQSEMNLRDSRNRLKITLQSIGDGIISTDANCLINLMNPIAERLTGWTQAEALGKPLHEIFRVIDEQTRLPIRNPATEVLATGNIARLANHAMLISKDGAETPVADSGAPICDEAGQITGVVLVFRDQTRERAARRAVEASEARYRQLFENMSAGFALHEMLCDEAGNAVDYRFLQVNPAFETMTGLPASEAVGHTIKELMPDIEPRWIENYSMVVRTGKAINFEDYSQSLEKYFDVRAFSPAPGQFAVTFSDITSRKKAEDRLLFEQNLFYSFMETIPAFVYFKDLQSRFVYINKQLADFFGKPKAEILGKTDHDFFPKEQADKKRADEMQVMQARQPVQIEELSGAVWHQTTKAPHYDKNGELAGTFGISWNVTDRKRLQDAVEKRILALTRPLDDSASITFDGLFGIKEIQRIQDEFAAATGVASIITLPDGTPITKPSNFTRLCRDLIRKTEKGCINCFHSDAALGRANHNKPVIQPCLSGGLWDAGVRITVGDRHIANWLIGQVRDETQTDEAMRAYAREIGVDEGVFIEAFHQVPSMSREHFAQIAQALFTLANQLSTSAYQNIQQARFISEQKNTENALRESQEYLAAMWEVMDIGIMMVDAKTHRILNVNPALIRLSGYRGHDLIGRLCHKLVCTAEEGKCPIGDLGHKLDRSERVLLNAAGEQIDVEKSVKPMVLNGREVYLETLLDIRERKRSQMELKRLSTAIEQSPEAVVITSPDGIIQYVNPAFEDITGYPREAILGKTPRILKSGRHDSLFYSNLWNTISSGKVWKGRFINRRKSGEIYTEEGTVSPVRNPAGQIVGYVAIKRDITEELSKEAQLQQSQKMQAIGQLAGGIAHDFNNILQAILGFSEILLARIDADSMSHNHVVEIQKAALRAADLTRQLLTFSRKQTAKVEPLNLNAVLDDAKTLVKMLVGEKIHCVFELDPDLQPVLADRGQITQIIMNLSVNARHAMSGSGQMVFSTENTSYSNDDLLRMPHAKVGEFVCLSVADNGKGMNREVLDHLFEPFFTTKMVGEGTGLGLSVVYGIIQQHKGWIRVTSEPDKGTVFKIYLPILHDSPSDTDSPGEPAPAHQSKQVLVVENNPETKETLLRVLAAAGHQTQTASCAQEALALWYQAKKPFDLLVSNLELPDQTGLELAEMLRKENPTLPVLLSGTQITPLKREKELDTKGYLFIQRPLQTMALLSALHTIFETAQKD